MSLEAYESEPYEAEVPLQVRGNVSIFQAHPDADEGGTSSATQIMQRDIHPQSVLSHVLAVIERN
ncbi:hypothetical protein JCM19233_5673 [Vibrio astriarenae]|nr:hypothetical protein JCM19233_5673 [Vibrio sp. C7]